MGKSLDFIKKCIATCQCDGIENDNCKSMFEFGAKYILRKKALSKEGYHYKLEDSPLDVVVRYNPDVDFEYIAKESCICDGTTTFILDLAYKCINRMFELKTFNINNIPKDLKVNECSIIYTVGDFVIVDEYSDEFSTKEKPWMNSRFTVMLPVRFDIVEK